jgi:sporulation protein YlmC with PRC-barrel domain
MKTTITIAMVLAAAALVTPAFAQNKPSPIPPPATSQANSAGEWRASKLVGVDVYNEQNEKVGDINEVLLAHTGKVAGVVIGVGGFLGMGEHDVLIPFDQIKFVNEPMRAASTAVNPPATTGSAGHPLPATGATVTTANTRSANEKWYPDHAVINATKEQLKAMQQFKYN